MTKQLLLFGDYDDGSRLSIFIGFAVRVRRRSDRVRAAQLAFLRALLFSKGRVVVDDVIRNLNEPFADGGKWLGPAINELSMHRLIKRAGSGNSRRRSRRGGLRRGWVLSDADKAQTWVRWLESVLELESDDSTGPTAEPS